MSYSRHGSEAECRPTGSYRLLRGGGTYWLFSAKGVLLFGGGIAGLLGHPDTATAGPVLGGGYLLAGVPELLRRRQAGTRHWPAAVGRLQTGSFRSPQRAAGDARQHLHAFPAGILQTAVKA
jgi:hypothetical protein